MSYIQCYPDQSNYSPAATTTHTYHKDTTTYGGITPSTYGHSPAQTGYGSTHGYNNTAAYGYNNSVSTNGHHNNTAGYGHHNNTAGYGHHNNAPGGYGHHNGQHAAVNTHSQYEYSHATNHHAKTSSGHFVAKSNRRHRKVKRSDGCSDSESCSDSDRD